LVEKPDLLEASKRSLALVPIPVRVEEQGANTSSAVVPNPFQPDKADDRAVAVELSKVAEAVVS
jgi:hypothetical protein